MMNNLDPSWLTALVDWIWLPLSATVGWFVRSNREFRLDMRALRKEIAEHKIHVAERHPTKNDVAELENRIVRELSSGIQSLKDLIEAKVGK